MLERRILYVTALVRAFTTSLIGVLMGLYLARQGVRSSDIGTVVSAGLLGATVAALVATLFGDRIGRRRLLLALAAFSTLGTLAFGFGTSLASLCLAAFFGMLNGMGRDRGAALILEQAALPGTTTADGRTQSIAWYSMLQDVGHAAGALVATLPTLLRASNEPAFPAHRGVFLGCAALGLLTLVLYARLGTAAETAARASSPPLTDRSRAILTKICALFAVDAIAGGFLTTALLSYFFFERFGAEEGSIGLLFFAARVMNAVSHLAAARLARRFGLVNTMVFTHIPSSLLLVMVAFAPSFPVAAALFLLREGLVEMDVPTRQSYVLAVVEPEERTFASGVTNLVRLAAWAAAPVVAGALMVGDSLYLPLVLGAALKITYDLLLWRAFRAVRPPEELGVRS